MRFAAGLAALTVAALPPPIAAQGGAGTFTDPSTGVTFPVELQAPGGGAQVLTGTGVRTRTVLSVKVYAFGLYVDPAGAKSDLAAFAGKTAKDLERDETFYGRLLERHFPMSLRLVMTRDVDGKTMSEAFDGALRPRVVRAATEKNMPGGEQALDQFRGFFSTEKLTKDSELVFSCSTEGRLATSIRGAASPEIDSPALCWALFDVYLGPNPISPNGKRSVIGNFPTLLAGS